jgi:carbonic anhydrase
MENLLTKLLENNQRWVEEKLSLDPDYFKELSRGQHPEIFYIGCSDSRVTAEDMLGLQPGEVFVHRNIANLVNTTDLNVMSGINYAVSHLKVKHIIVCGHYECGGVNAAMESKDLGILNPWLRNIRDVYRMHREELDAINRIEERYKRLVELNIMEQCVNVIKTAEVQQRYILEKYPKVHGWVFDIKTGKVKELKIDLQAILANIQTIYNLTDHNWF